MNGSWAGMLRLSLGIPETGTDSPVPQENRMAPGTLSQGGRRGGAEQRARPPPPGPRESTRAGVRTRAVSAVDASADTGSCVAARGLRETNLHRASHVGAASGACPLSLEYFLYPWGSHTPTCPPRL